MAGPVRDRRQHEAGNGCRSEAEDHFVSVPSEWREGSRQRDMFPQDGNPKQDSDTAPDANQKARGRAPAKAPILSVVGEQ